MLWQLYSRKRTQKRPCSLQNSFEVFDNAVFFTFNLYILACVLEPTVVLHMLTEAEWVSKSQLPKKKKTWFNATWLPLQRQVLLTAYKVQACAVWRYDTEHEPQVALHLYCIHQEHPSDWITVMWLWQHSQACMCICTSPDRPFLTFVVTTVSMRNVFYYGLLNILTVYSMHTVAFDSFYIT